jgi:hypothetical protein
MSKIVIIRLTCSGGRTGPFNITDNEGNVLGTDITKQNLIDGYTVSVDDAIDSIIITSAGKCNGIFIEVSIGTATKEELAALTYTVCNTGSIWRHLTDTLNYNKFYGNIEPYIIEYPFSYQSYDEILQNIKDYSKVYNYLPLVDGVFNDNAQIQVDNQWFNKAVLYNGQQSTGVLELVPKPINNLSAYLTYPIYNTNSKTIMYTKSDNFYQYNTFWSLVKNKSIPLFITSCDSLSIDKVVNQTNMDYGKRSFKKEPLRAKDLKVRHILDNSSEAHIVSQFIVAPAQISYK